MYRRVHQYTPNRRRFGGKYHFMIRFREDLLVTDFLHTKHSERGARKSPAAAGATWRLGIVIPGRQRLTTPTSFKVDQKGKSTGGLAVKGASMSRPSSSKEATDSWTNSSKKLSSFDVIRHDLYYYHAEEKEEEK